MAILRRAQSSDSTDVVNINSGSSASAALSIARVTNELGGDIAAMGIANLQKAQKALSTAVYDMHMQKATDEFRTRSAERMSNTTDDNGNPNFGTLADDIDGIGQNVKSNRFSLMLDPNASKQFNRDFGNFVSSQTMQAASRAQAMELDYNKAQVNTTVQTTIDKGVAGDMTEVDNNIDILRKSLDSYLDAGVISKREYDAHLVGTAKTIYKTKWGQLIEQNPDMAKSVLTGDNAPSAIGLDGIGLNEIDKLNMAKQAEAKIQDNIRNKNNITKDFERQQSESRKSTLEAIKTSVLAGKAGEADMHAAFNTGAIDQAQLNKGILFARSQAVQQTEKADKQLTLTTDIEKGNNLMDYTSKDIDTYVNTKIAALEEGTQKKLTMGQKAELVSDIGHPVSTITKELWYKAKQGTLEEGAESYHAWSYLTNKNNVAISGMKQDGVALYSMVDSIVRSSNVPAEKAVEMARGIQESLVPERIAELTTEFADESLGFAIDDMNKEANDIADEGFLFFGKEDLAPGTKQILLNSFQTAYLQVDGDKDATRAMVKSLTKDVLGTTNVGGREQIMFLAPEKMFPQLESDDLDLLMRADFPEIPEGAEVIIESDRGSRRIPGEITYPIAYIGDDGIPKQLGRWSLSNAEVNKYLQGEFDKSLPDIQKLIQGKKDKTVRDKLDKESIDIFLDKHQG